MSPVTRGMGISGSGTGGGDGYPVINIVESIKGKIISEVDVKTIIAIQSDIIKGKVK